MVNFKNRLVSLYSLRHTIRGAMLSCLVACALLLLSLAGAAAAAPYDLMVLVYAPDDGPAQVALGYAGLVDHTVVRNGIAELARRSGAAISGINLRDQQQGQGVPAKATAAEFTAIGLLSPLTGALPVGAIIRSLPEWQHARLVFVVGERFTFTGPVSVRADGFSLQLVNAMKPYEYDVERSTEGAPATAPAVRPRKARPQPWLPALLIGLPIGALVGWLASDRGTGRVAARLHRSADPAAPKGDNTNGT